MKNIMIVEDQKMIRGLLEMYVENMSEYKLAASISNASYAVKECREQDIDLILMDVMTENEESGLDATVEIKKSFPDVKVLVVTSLLDDAVLKKAKEVGADSLWYKDVSQEELMDVAKRTMNGEHVFPDLPPEVPIGDTTSYDFTDREKEILRFLIRGWSYPEIAREMDVAVPTVKFHVTNMLQKTGCKDKLMLALAVQSAKIIVNGF